VLDEPYWSLARELTAESEGQPSKHELHMELETGAFPHATPQFEGPASGEPWDLLESEVAEREAHSESTETLLDDASLGLENGYIPHEGDRVAMRGRWIIDCGHNDFHGELHPLTFMAFGHQEGAKTVVHVLANGYRVTQLYGSGTEEVNGPAKGKPFGPALEESITKLVKTSVATNLKTPLSLLVGIEKTLPSTVPFNVCAPEGEPGPLTATYNFVKRTGVTIEAKHAKRSQCATFNVTINPEKYKAQQPRSRTCEMPWPWLSERIRESLGLEGVKASEVESIKVNATGGTFTITYAGETTEQIKWNATAGEVELALDALGAVEPGDIHVLGGPGGSNPYTLVFAGNLANQAITPVTTDRSGLTGGKKLASVVVLRPGGELDLRRFILSEIEQGEKVALEEEGAFSAIGRIEENVALTPITSCLDPLSAPAPNPEKHLTMNNHQAFPFYGEVTVER
jgi:hypothetical protein